MKYIKSEDSIRCPNCKSYHDTGDNDLIDYEGQTLTCKECGSKYDVVECESTIVIKTALKE